MPARKKAPAAPAPDAPAFPHELLSWRALDTLVPYARNARIHTEAQVAQIAACIEEFGFTSPILADERGVVAGHGRVLAARRLRDNGRPIRLPSGVEVPLGMLPVLDCSGWSEAQRRAYIIADNKIALNAGWDASALQLELADLEAEEFDTSVLGFSSVELAAILTRGELAGTAAEHWTGMPECEAEDRRAFRQVLVSFANQADCDRFAHLLGLELTEKTKAVWYPKQEWNRTAHEDYARTASA